MTLFILQVVAIVTLFLMSAFFAGTETGVYRLSRLHLRIGVERKKSGFRLLDSMLRDGQGLILSVLVGNNLVNYAVTSLVTVMLLGRLHDSHTAEVYATVMLTPTLFIAGEIVPKILYFHKANTLMPSLAWAVWLANRLFTVSGIIPLLKGISAALSRLFHSQVNSSAAVDATQRHQVRPIIHETQEEALLSDAQKEMMERLMDLGDTAVRTVMVPLETVEMVPVDTHAEALLAHLAVGRHTCLPVYENKRPHIRGCIHIYDVLSQEASFKTLGAYIRPLPEIDHRKNVIEAIDVLRQQKTPMALVTAPNKTETLPVGIVTLTDLVEELTGELPD